MLDIFRIQPPKRGAQASFKPFHILMAMHDIRKHGPTGRKALADATGLGEGSVRNLIKHLEEHNLADQTDSGLKATKKTSRFLNDARLLADEIDAGTLTVDNFDHGVRLKNVCDSLSDGIVQRDEAIKAGASGATTLLYEAGRLILPDHFDVQAAVPEAADRICQTFEPESGDLIIIGSASNLQKAKDGAFAAATWILSE